MRVKEAVEEAAYFVEDLFGSGWCWRRSGGGSCGSRWRAVQAQPTTTGRVEAVGTGQARSGVEAEGGVVGDGRQWDGGVDRGEVGALGGGEGVECGGLLWGDGAGGVGLRAGRGDGEHDGGGGWAAAVGGFLVDDFAEVAVLEEDVLVGGEVIDGGAEGFRDLEDGCAVAAIFYAGVAFAGDAQAEIERAGREELEAHVGREDDVLRARGAGDFDGSAVEAEEERVLGVAVQQVHGAGGADAELAATVKGDGGGVVIGDDVGVGDEVRALGVDVEAAGELRVGGGDGAHGFGLLLGVQRRREEQERGDAARLRGGMG